MTVCSCPFPEYISGKHCERVRCANGGDADRNREATGVGPYCRCLTDWYHGDFCQYYSSPWVYILSVPILLVLFFLIVCLFSRLSLCRKRRRATAANRSRCRRRSRPAGHASTAPPPRDIPPPGVNPMAMQRYAGQSQPTRQTVSLVSEQQVLLIDPPPYRKPEQQLPKPAAPPPSYDEVVGNLQRFPTVAPSTAPSSLPPPPHQLNSTDDDQRTQ